MYIVRSKNGVTTLLFNRVARYYQEQGHRLVCTRSCRHHSPHSDSATDSATPWLSFLEQCLRLHRHFNVANKVKETLWSKRFGGILTNPYVKWVLTLYIDRKLALFHILAWSEKRRQVQVQYRYIRGTQPSLFHSRANCLSPAQPYR